MKCVVNARPATSLAALLLVAGSLALTDCSATSPAPSAPTPQTPPISPAAGAPGAQATPPPATTAEPTTPASGASSPAKVPEAARARTPEGAKAFTAYFVGQFNRSWTTPDSRLVSDLCNLSTSPSCRDFVRVADELAAKDRRYDGNPITMRSYTPQPTEGSIQPVLAVGVQERRNVVDRSGSIVLTDQRKPLRAVYSLVWTPSGWRVANVQLAG